MVASCCPLPVLDQGSRLPLRVRASRPHNNHLPGKNQSNRRSPAQALHQRHQQIQHHADQPADESAVEANPVQVLAHPRLDQLLHRWEELCQQGGSPSAEELCSTCPELAGELARRIALLRAFDPLLTDSILSTAVRPGPESAGGPSRESASALYSMSTAMPRHGGSSPCVRWQESSFGSC